MFMGSVLRMQICVGATFYSIPKTMQSSVTLVQLSHLVMDIHVQPIHLH